MPSRYGDRIDSAIDGIVAGNPEQEQETNPEIDAKIKEIYDKLHPTLKEIRYWGTICDNPEALQEAIEFYDTIRDYPKVVSQDGEALFNRYRLDPEAIAMSTQRWAELDEESKKEALEKGELSEDVWKQGVYTLTYTIKSLDDIANGRIPDGICYTSYLDQSNLRKSVEHWTLQGKDLTQYLAAACNGPYKYKGWMERMGLWAEGTHEPEEW